MVAELEGRIVGSVFLDERSAIVSVASITVDPAASLALHVPGYTVRRATKGDLDECNALCVRVHGHDRRAELVEAIERGKATVWDTPIVSPATRPGSGSRVTS